MHHQVRSFLRLDDFSPNEILHILQLSTSLKYHKKMGNESRRLCGRNVVLLFDKTSTRTRCAFEVACADQGASLTYLSPGDSQVGVKESLADTAAVLGRMYDAIVYRGYAQSIVDTFAEHSGVPVINALTNEFHPTQMLADLLTMCEFSGRPLKEIRYAYLGDARFNIGNSLLALGAQMGMDVRIAAPRELWPHSDWIDYCRGLAEKSGAHINITEDPQEAVKDVAFIHTDVWVSMGESEETWHERINMLKPYRVDRPLLEKTGNPNVYFMHCLPAFHDRNTQISEHIFQQYALDGIEVSDDVFSSNHSLVFEQAENRMHTIKALLITLLERP